MKVYIIKQKNQEGKEYRRAVVRITNDLTGEETYFSGIYESYIPARKWGEKNQLEGFADLMRDRKKS